MNQYQKKLSVYKQLPQILEAISSVRNSSECITCRENNSITLFNKLVIQESGVQLQIEHQLTQSSQSEFYSPDHFNLKFLLGQSREFILQQKQSLIYLETCVDVNVSNLDKIDRHCSKMKIFMEKKQVHK
ncbi:Hypothetical_protein [Hexamita inflata]|uniref:Hypothetical_protein n=1 Tax=Hexamita inflata TaxID=28002 RepID=A0AA86TRW7_9EUKA|nr:Hypothetical protein HINF_LOCUS14429 [Hexamita inflata]